MRLKVRRGRQIHVLIALTPGSAFSRGPTAPPAMVLQDKSTDAVPHVAAKEIRMLTATVAPGEASVWHTHETSPIVYVISGEFRLEMNGRPSRALHAPSLPGRVWASRWAW